MGAEATCSDQMCSRCAFSITKTQPLVCLCRFLAVFKTSCRVLPLQVAWVGAVVADYLCSCLKAASLNQILKFGRCRVYRSWKLPPRCWEWHLLPLGLTCPRELQAQGLSAQVMTEEDSMIPPLFLNHSQSKLLHRSSRIAQKWLHQIKSSSKTKIAIHNVDWYTVYCDVEVGVCSSLCTCVQV